MKRLINSYWLIELSQKYERMGRQLHRLEHCIDILWSEYPTKTPEMEYDFNDMHPVKKEN